MKLVDVELLKRVMDKGNIVIGEDILECETPHEWLVYLLAKVSEFLDEEIDKLPTYEPKWIPCSERLPKETGTYIVTELVDFGNGTTMKYVTVRTYAVADGWLNKYVGEFEAKILAWWSEACPKLYREDSDEKSS